MLETHVFHTKPCSRMQSLSESRGESKVTKPIFNNSGKSYSPITSPRGAYIWRGDLTEDFFTLPVWGAYIWRGLFSEFYGTSL